MAKLRYEPNRIVGGAFGLIGACTALAIYYDLVTPEGAALWGSLAAVVIPPIQAEIARRFTWSTAKIADAATVDASLEPEAIEQKARLARGRRRVARERANGDHSV